jgi:hypothetical protein
VSDFEANAASATATPRFVIAGRLLLLLLAAVATVWAFAFSGERASVRHAGVERAGGHQHHARGHERHAAGHEHHAARHEHHATPAGTQDHKVIGAARRQLVALAVRAPAWVDADGLVSALLRREELDGLVSGEQGMFFPASAPAEGAQVRLGAQPPAPWADSAARLRFRLAGRGAALRPGAVGWVVLAARSREVLVIPSGAVLYSAAGPYVLAVGADGGAPARRSVEIGSVSRGLAVVLAGLGDGEPIIVGSAFSWDVQRRLQPRHDTLAGANP